MTDNIKIATAPNSVFAVRFAHPNAFFGTSQTGIPLGDI